MRGIKGGRHWGGGKKWNCTPIDRREITWCNAANASGMGVRGGGAE